MKLDTLKSLKKALDILNLFLGSQNELNLSEIIKLSGLSKSTAMRMISVLMKYEYLQQREKKG